METLIFVWTIVKAVLGISFVIFWHELGHFLLAKWNGVYVKTFSIGFPPRLLRLFRYKETDYVIGSIPLGGYVHMLGEDEGQVAPAPGEPSETDAEGEPRAGIDPTIADHPGAFFNKSVWARMAIISAGVVMNVVLGFLCFVAVYLVGGKMVIPAVVGHVIPGGPAYRAGMLPGDAILAIDGQRDVAFADLNRIVIHSGPDQEVDFTIRRSGVAEPFSLKVKPERDPISDVPTIRIAASSTLRLSELQPFMPPTGLETGQGSPGDALKPGDAIKAIGVEGEEPLPVSTPSDLERLLDRHRDEPLVLVVERSETADDSEAREDRAPPATDRIEVRLPPARFVAFGFRLTPGPIVAFRPDAPAKAAGLMLGDRIIAVDGDRGYDPLRLPSIAASRVGEPIALTVLRDGKERTIEVRPVEGASWTSTIVSDSPLGVDALGLAMAVTPRIATVRDGSPAERAGIKPGQTIESVTLTEPDLDGEPGKTETVVLGEDDSWPFLFDLIQQIDDSKIALTLSGSDRPITLRPEPVADWFYAQRGLVLMPDRAPLPPMPLVESLGRAGVETTESITSFYTLLRRLFERRVGTSGLSGPIGIGRMAFELAGVDLMTFVYFIGFISLNLAVVNFLPIPPLDGGRMIFLIGEAVRGRPLPESWQALPTYVGLFLLLCLMAFVIVQDVLKFF